MITTIKRLVKVQAEGRIAFQSDELREGESAEVFVVVDRAGSTSPAERLTALHKLRQQMNLTPTIVEQWESDLQSERVAWRDTAAK